MASDDSNDSSSNTWLFESSQTKLKSSLTSTADWLFAKHSTTSTIPKLANRNNLKEYSLSQVMEHDQNDDCWIVVEDLVYDVTEFLHDHPGGHYIVMEHAGRDATMVFRGSSHSKDAYDMLKKYLIGILVENERIHWSRCDSSDDLFSSSSNESKSLL
ncbi:cytochrome b5-like protein [Sarcoptes scabiei]|nr:cytochrome b5-like protein [Sarcoptes scabiei]